MSRYWNDFKAIDISEDELCHFGVLGMKWGVRRYQNADGTLTQAGKDRLKIKTRHLHMKAMNHDIHSLFCTLYLDISLFLANILLIV